MTEEHWAKLDRPAGMPIPGTLNVALCVLTIGGGVALLWTASFVSNPWAVAASAVAFSYLMLTNYALLHEAVHWNLHPTPWVNHALGRLTGALFPVPYSLVRTTHQGHHLRNRTDYEMFDLYYESDSAWLARGQWYAVLLGLFWPVVPIGSVLVALCPALLRRSRLHEYRSNSAFIDDLQGPVTRSIRLELLGIIAGGAGIAWLLGLQWLPTLICYGCFAFNWSTRQYIAHAFTVRHVRDGAWNLRHNRFMSALLLRGEYDLNHHRRPDVPWNHLPKLSEPDESRRSYVGQYFRQWRGPRLTREPGPEASRDLRLQVHA